MHKTSISLVIVIAVILIHFSYVDFRFRYREGMGWFWMLNPAPPLMWLGRATIVATVIAALSGIYFGVGETLVIVVCGLMLLHIISLILLEVLEPR
jgi:hypothetical protein